MIDMLDWWMQLQGALFESVVQPLAFSMGAGNVLEDAYDATGWLMLGVLQIGVLLLVIGPAQRLWPVEPVTDRQAIRVDVLYTLLHRLGVFKLIMFFTLEAWVELGIGWLRVHGLPTFHVDQIWPGVTDHALVSFAIYLVVFDFVAWAIHWAQHRFDWWWQLHAVHHSQRQMTMWSDNRNHLLDSVISDLVVVAVALLIGVGPSQFVALIVFSQLMESLQHANLRWRFGAVGERLLVSPSFHRRHHGVWLGHSPEQLPETHTEVDRALAERLPYGANFGVLFPWWDMVFRTADFTPGWGATGISDQITRGRDYGRGFWQQQWLGLKRLFQREA